MQNIYSYSSNSSRTIYIITRFTRTARETHIHIYIYTHTHTRSQMSTLTCPEFPGFVSKSVFVTKLYLLHINNKIYFLGLYVTIFKITKRNFLTSQATPSCVSESQNVLGILELLGIAGIVAPNPTRFL